MANLSVFEDMNPDSIRDDIIKYMRDEFDLIMANPEHSFWKSKARAQDRFAFLTDP